MLREMWDRRFAEAGEAFVFGESPNHFLEAEAGWIPPGASVLSVADGEGRNSVWLAGRGCRVHALEFSPVALDKARRFAGRGGVEVAFEQADVLSWSWPQSRYDAVVAIFIQFATPAQRSILFRRMGEALKPGGVLLLHGYTPQQVEYGTGGPPCADHMYTEALLADAFAGFERLCLRSYEREMREGSGHQGRSALIDLVVRRPAWRAEAAMTGAGVAQR